MKRKTPSDSLRYLEHAPRSETISIVPIPFDWGADHGDDLAKGPRYFIDNGIETVFETAGIKTNLLPELRVSKSDRKKFHAKTGDIITDLQKVLVDIRDVVSGEVGRKRPIIALGGDHTIAMGTIAGAAAALKGNLGVIWVDIHPDAHTYDTSITKNPHGMPTMVVMGEGEKRLTSIVTHPIKKKNFLYIGTRDADQGEIDNMRKHKVENITMMDIAEHGIGIALRGVERLNKKVKNVWISIDLDSIDHQVAPGTTMATPGSFTHREIVTLMTAIGKTCNVVGIDLVEMTPGRDIDRKTVLIALEIAAACFGAKYSWYTRYMEAY